VTYCQGQKSTRTPYRKFVVTEEVAEAAMGPDVRSWNTLYRNAYPGAPVVKDGVPTPDTTVLDDECQFESTIQLPVRTSAAVGRSSQASSITRTSAAVGPAAPSRAAPSRVSRPTGRARPTGRRGRGGRRLSQVPEDCESKRESILCVDAPKKGSGSGDPHFKTWTGDKYDYHGECDLVLVDNPTFNNGQGLKLHIRTTSVKYFSYIERVALQIGDDVLEFDNDVDNFLINGKKVGAAHKHHKTMLGGFVVRRDPKAISIRLNKSGKKTNQDDRAKIDFHTRKNGFPGVIVDGGNTDIFAGSLGLLGEYATGIKMARDGASEMNDKDATAFATEWQVRDDEPMLFKDARFPQFPSTCTPPKKQLANRLGHATAVEEATKACAHWKEDMEDCIFDVIATRDVTVAEEGHMVNIQ